jgi:CubicO group peptidase (beta-lactamase class C family)
MMTTLRDGLPAEAGFSVEGLDTVDRLITQALDRVFTAAVVLIARQGTVAFHRAYGYLDPEARRRPTPDDALFDLASLTKLFTATAFMRLMEAGAASLSTPVADIVPEFAGRRPIVPTLDPLTHGMQPVPREYAGQSVEAGEVTCSHLLTHTSGLPGWAPLYQEPGLQEAMQSVFQSPFARPPGAEVIYSDLGLILLGEAVSRLYGGPLDAALADLVFAPLELRDMGYNPPPEWAARIPPTELCPWRGRRVHGEVHDENAARLDGISGHAGLFATAQAVATLGQCYLNGGDYGGARLLSPELVSRMTQEQVRSDTTRRGLGWLLQSAHTASAGRRLGQRAFGHTGFTGTSVWADPDLGLLVVALTNRVYYGRDARAITTFRSRLHDGVVEALRA